MEYLAKVRDGSTGELHDGYGLGDITAAEVKSSEIVPLYQELYSAEAEEFRSENAEILAAVDLARISHQVIGGSIQRHDWGGGWGFWGLPCRADTKGREKVRRAAERQGLTG